MVTRMVLLVLLLVLVGQSTEEGVRTMEEEEKRSTMEKVDVGRSIEEEEEEEVRPPLAALGYLAQYGHLLPPGGNASMFDSFEAGLLRFQGWLGLHRTGVLDRETVAAMGRPRCGCRTGGSGAPPSLRWSWATRRGLAGAGGSPSTTAASSVT